MPFLRQYDVPVIVNAWGRSVEEYVDVVSRLSQVDGIAGFEVNVSCPNIKEGGHLFGTAMEGFSAVLTAVRDTTDMPLIVKLSPNVADIGAFARRAQELGMDAVSLINSLPAMAIDVETRRPVLGNVTGGLSGPAIHPVAVKLVWEAAKAVEIPVIAMGGIAEAKDALDFFIAGASAVAVGTANFTDPLTVLRVIDGLRAYLADHGHSSINDIIGTLQV
jgi:dihydroorotate dehydrogenase (NAD+) catalytic subunit